MRVVNIFPAVALLSTTSAQLHKAATTHGKYFGSATDNYEWADEPYKEAFLTPGEFGQITPSNLQKWFSSEPQQGVFNFTGGDQIAEIAKENGYLFRCHPMVWHSQLPSWVSSGTWTNETLIAVMKAHIKGVATHWKGKCDHWDVVNEAFEEDGSYRKSIFYNTIGPEYIPIAFETAAMYDENVKLFYNDYNLEYNGAKTEATRTLVKQLKARGIKIDAVGYQGHLLVGSTPSEASLTANLKSFTDLGVEVAYTELDIRYPALPSTETTRAQQDVDYTNVVKSCLNVEKCLGITIWDFTDKYSWIPGVFTGQGDALLWDLQIMKKQVYYAVLKALGGTVPTSTSSVTTAPATSSTTAVPVTSTTSSKLPTSTLIKCNRDNCLRNLVDERYSASASAFCSTYTTAVLTASSAIPTYLAGCSGLPSRVSSACTCVVTSVSSTMASTTMASTTIAMTTSSTMAETTPHAPVCTDD